MTLVNQTVKILVSKKAITSLLWYGFALYAPYTALTAKIIYKYIS